MYREIVNGNKSDNNGRRFSPGFQRDGIHNSILPHSIAFHRNDGNAIFYREMYLDKKDYKLSCTPYRFIKSISIIYLINLLMKNCLRVLIKNTLKENVYLNMIG